ncbi:hypothetical protein STBA_18390 [Streptomyces sp. MP131-18]|nr:hypothetical protein STBA_18390 [Streptomyces sp. MP131-18]
MELYEDDRPTPSAMLSRRMRRAREGAGLSLRGLSEKIHFPYGFLGRVERGEQPATEALVKELDKFFRADSLFTELLDMVQELSVPDYNRDFARRERESVRIQVFTSSLVPGLLQTPEYARELFRTTMQGDPDSKVQAHVDFRMKRQRLLDAEDAPFYWAILDEAVLRRPTKDRGLMLQQVERILTMAQRPRVTIQVLPFRQALHPMLGGSVSLLTLKNGGGIAYIESFATGDTADSPKRFAAFSQRFDVARSMSLPEDESAEILRYYAKEYEHAAAG